MNYLWSTNIDKLMLWRAGSWTRYGSKLTSPMLRIHYDQLLITADAKVLESFNMHGKMKGIFKEDILILVVGCCENRDQEIRKLKFQIKFDVAECLQKLGDHFPILSHDSTQGSLTCKYRIMQDFFEKTLSRKANLASLPLPSTYKNFVKLCLLDPNFPQMVLETEIILREDIMKKQNPN